MIKRLLFSLFIISWFTYTPLLAGKIMTVDDSNDSYLLSNEFIEIMEDSSGKMTLEDVRSNLNAGRFHSVERNYALNENLNSVYWVRFRIKNLSDQRRKWLLEVMDSRQDEIILYQPGINNTYESSIAGINDNFSNREYEHKNFIFEILPSQKEQYYYIRVKSEARTSFLMKISTSKFIMEYGLSEYYLLGLYYGILLMMAIYSLFVFFVIREKVYLLYLLYIAGWMYSSMLADGTGFQYIWTDFPIISKLGVHISRPLLLGLFVFYSLEFLRDPEKNILNRKHILISLAAYLIYYPTQYLIEFSILSNILFLLPFFLIFFYSIRSLRAGYQPARYFLLGNSVIMLSITITLLKYNGLLDFVNKSDALSIIVVYSTNIAMVIEIVILSFAMADRLKYFKNEKEKTQQLLIGQLEENQKLSNKVNRELEEKVKERTKEIEEKSMLLEEANAKLQEQSRQINEMNAKLDLDNWKLKKSIIEEKESRIKFKEISFDEFKQVYTNENACYQFLEELKWEKGFSCKRCGNDKFGKGNHQFSRRCTKCRYDESVTADTIFHKCKFDINKALYILVMVNRYGEKQSISDLATELDLRVATCWNFAQKVLKIRNSREYGKLDDESKFQFLILQEVTV